MKISKTSKTPNGNGRCLMWLRYSGCVLATCAVLVLAACGSAAGSIGGQSTAGGSDGGSGGTRAPADPCSLVTTGQMAAVVGVSLTASNQGIKTTCDYADGASSATSVASVAAFAQSPDGWTTVKSASQQAATQGPGSGLEYQSVSEPGADAFFGGDTTTAFKDGVQITVWIGQLPNIVPAQLAGSPALLVAETTIMGEALSRV